MRLNSALTFISLFVSAALSGPLREKDQSWVPNLVKKSTNGTSDGVYYADLFAGAYWEETDGGFTFATATFHVPALPPGQPGYAVWVAIDGIQNNDTMLSAGIITFVKDNSETTYRAWCYWGHSGVPYFSNITITPKDDIKASITALNATSGTVLIENLSNGQADAHPLLVNSTQSLVEVSWGVALYQVNDSIPFDTLTIPFDTLTITNATAYGPSGKKYEAEGGNKKEIKQDNKDVTSVETKGSTIRIQHVYE